MGLGEQLEAQMEGLSELDQDKLIKELSAELTEIAETLEYGWMHSKQG